MNSATNIIQSQLAAQKAEEAVRDSSSNDYATKAIASRLKKLATQR